MRPCNALVLGMILSGLLLIGLGGSALAEEARKPAPADGESLFPGLHSEVQFTGEGYGGPDESAKFQEYRDLPQGGQVDWLKLEYGKEDRPYNANLKVKNAGLEDMDLLFTQEKLGVWKSSFEFNRIPHRFETEAGSLFSGLGTGKLRIPDAIQAGLQSAPDDATMLARLRGDVHDEAVHDIMLQRDQFKLSFSFLQLDPFTLGIDLSHEERYGDRPIGGAFGNELDVPIQLVEPIDYGTTDASIWAAYDRRPLHVKVFYGFDYFENRIGALSFSNPYRVTDSPVGVVDFGVREIGPKEGRIALYPDNLEHRAGFDAAYDAPARTRITAGYSYTWRVTDEEMLAYSDNPSINPSIPLVPGGPVVPIPPFDTSAKANLPESNYNGDVQTQLLTFGVTNRCVDHLELRLKYRLYNFDNASDQLTFPGRVEVDREWVDGPFANVVSSYAQQQGDIEATYDLGRRTSATIGYKFQDMERDQRQVDAVWDHTVLCALDTAPVGWMHHRISYEHTWRLPTGYNPEPDQLPFLRKYDESRYQRDKVNVQLEFPTEKFTPTAGYALLFTDYDTHFGLTQTTRHAVNAGVIADPWDRMHATVNGNWEWGTAEQGARDFTPGGIGDPFVTDTGEFSFSNWTATSHDRILTLNGGAVFHLVTDKLDLDLSYTFQHAGEGITFGGPVGTPANDNHPYDPSLFNLTDAANATWNKGRLQFRWSVKKNITVVFGYLFEEFASETARRRDYTSTGFLSPADGSLIPFLGLNTEPQDYESHAGFVSVVWSF